MLQLKHKAEMARALANNPLVVVKFSAPWCVPCQGYAPIFESTEKKFNGKDGKRLFVHLNFFY